MAADQSPEDNARGALYGLLSKDIADLREDFKDLRKGLAEQIDRVLGQVQTEYANLGKDIAHLRADISDTKSDVNELKAWRRYEADPVVGTLKDMRDRGQLAWLPEAAIRAQKAGHDRDNREAEKNQLEVRYWKLGMGTMLVTALIAIVGFIHTFHLFGL